MLTGVQGQIRWHHYSCAAVHGFTVARGKDRRTWSLVGIVGVTNAFNLTQTPLTFVAPHAKGSWRWPVVSFVVDANKRLTAKLGPLQEK
jgi:hypothetical protein